MPKGVDETRIFEVVASLFGAGGYDAVRTRKVAELAGVSEMTLFRRYGDKMELVKAALHARLTDDDYARVRKTGDLRADLVRVVEAWRDAHARNGPIVFMLLSQSVGNPMLREIVGAVLASNVALVELLKQYQIDGLLPDISPNQLTSRLIAPLMVSDLLNRATGRIPAAELSPERHVDLYLNGLATEKCESG